MKTKFIFILFSVVLFTSCIKTDELKPLQNQILGVWVSTNPAMRFDIKNIDGQGSGVTFIEVTKVPYYYLTVKDGDQTTNYGIRQPSDNKLYLTDPNGLVIEFTKSN